MLCYFNRFLVPMLFLGIVLLLAPAAEAAILNWDPDGNLTSDGGDGTWDTVAPNWVSGGVASTWNNGADAVFGKKADNSTNNITIASASNVTVGNVTLEGPSGTGAVSFTTDNDGDGLTVASGGATWELGGRTLHFVNNNNAFDTALFMSSGDTLIVTDSDGGGVFNAGEKPSGANWGVGGASLDIRDGITLRGTKDSIGRFDSVIMSDGSAFFYERNQDQIGGNAIANDWELSGTVTFDNRFVRRYDLSGVVRGSGTLRIANLNGGNNNNIYLRLAGANTHTGGVLVDSTDSRTELNVTQATGDAAFGAVPVVLDADNILLRNGGELKINGVTISPTRGVTLDGGGVIVNTGSKNTYGGTISGSGGLQIGRSVGADGNALVLTSNTHNYTGGTHIFQGRIELGIDNALPVNQVLTIGGKGTSRLDVKGFDQEVAGLQTSANANTRQVFNDGGSLSTLTIDVANGESYSYEGNFAGADAIAVIKEGPGTQIFNKSTSTTTPLDALTVQAGTFLVNGNVLDNMLGPIAVNGGTLGGTGTIGGVVTVDSATIAPGLSPGTLSLGGLELNTNSVVEFEFEGSDTTIGTSINDLIEVAGDLTLDGTLNVSELTAASFMSAATGDTWRLFNYTGTLTDNGLNLGSLPNLNTGRSFGLKVTSGQVDLVIIPEPTSLGLIGLAVLLASCFLPRKS